MGLTLCMKSAHVVSMVCNAKRQPALTMSTKAATKGKSTAKAKKVTTKARIAKDKIKASGANTRVKGHLKATVRRKQAKRDAKNS